MTRRADWSAVALSASLEPGTSAGTFLDGKELVVWRDNSGAAHVWEDRCPHRGMRMSFGFVRGDHLACLYHGWQYDTAGQCRAIPAHPNLDVPKTIKIATYPVQEAHGMIWTSMAADASPEPVTGAGPLLPGDLTPLRSLYIDVPMAGAAAALAAVTLPFAGETTLAPVAGHSNLWILSSGAGRLLVAGQVLGPVTSALHLVILSGPADGAARIALCRWAERFRAGVEGTRTTGEAA